MKIVVTSSSHGIYWYSEHVGKEFEVIRVEKPTQLYWVREPDGHLNFIRFEDAKEVVPYSTEDFEKDCYKFNCIAGKDKPSGLEALKQQSELILEEAKETLQAAEENRLEGVLDGCMDVLVTAFGLKQQLEAMGVDTSKAMRLVAQNNLSKFTKSPATAEMTVQYYKNQGIDTSIAAVTYNGETYFIIKDKNQKVRKPVTFESVNLSDCLPK